MKHRHLIEQPTLTLAAIDDIIERGKVEDWIELRTAADKDPEVKEKIRKICAARKDDLYSPERYHLWGLYANERPEKAAMDAPKIDLHEVYARLDCEEASDEAFAAGNRDEGEFWVSAWNALMQARQKS